MIDIHSHLVPGVDDGSRDLNQSLEMLKQAEQEGITHLITTPHYMKNGSFRIEADRMKERFQRLVEAYTGPIQLFLGNELYIHHDLPELLEEGRVLTLAQTQYLLVEFPFHHYHSDFDEILYELSLNYQIIIAHPERYSYVQENPNFCLRWLREGYLLQSNQNSLFQGNLRKTLLPMIENGMVRILASDAHNENRPLSLLAAKQEIETLFGTEKAQELTEENPLAVLEGRELRDRSYQPIEKKREWLFFKAKHRVG